MKIMLTRSRMIRDFAPRPARRAAALLALLAVISTVAPSFEAQAQKRREKEPTTGTIEVSTTPGGNPLYIDGVYSGETTESVRVFANLRPGPHTVEIVFPNGTRWSHIVNTAAGRKECIALNYRPRPPIEPPPLLQSPCPYPVNVSAPATAAEGDMITFTADVAYTGQSALNYTWTVSPPTAVIRNGAGTPTITVDTTGSGRRVTAILVVDDGSGDRACRQTAQASTLLPPPPPPPAPVLDEFVSVAPDDDKARLDLLAIKMQENPTYRAFVIAYGGCGRRDRGPEVLLERAYSYLVRDRGMDANRITGIIGGYRERNGFELHVQSPGLSNPTPRPTRAPCTGGRGARR